MVASGSAKAAEMVASRRQGASSVTEYCYPPLTRTTFYAFTVCAVATCHAHAARMEYQHYSPAFSYVYTAAPCSASDGHGNVKRAEDVYFFYVAKIE